MADLDYQDHQAAVLDGVQHAVISHTDAPCVGLALQLGDTRRPRILRESFDPGHHATLDGLVQRAKIALRTWGKQNGIAHDLETEALLHLGQWDRFLTFGLHDGQSLARILGIDSIFHGF